MRPSRVQFVPGFRPEQHRLYESLSSRMVGFDLLNYREVFERLFAEVCIIRGEHTDKRELPPDYRGEATVLAFVVGRNEHSPRRVRLGPQFFERYDRLGRDAFLRGAYKDTAYYQDLLERPAPAMGLVRGLRWRIRRRRAIYRRVVTFLELYERMRAAGSLVPRRGDHLSPWDIPWAIDYGGYVKLRDGAHRRAIAHYLGWPTIPHLVFDLTRVDRPETSVGYIRSHFQQFREAIKAVQGVA